MKNVKRSLIFQYFTKENLLEIYRRTLVDTDNNKKAQLITEYLKEQNIPFESLGNGTNRLGINIDGYAVKIALDRDGMIDNQREMLYSKDLQPYVAKMYECLPNGLLGVLEYVHIFTYEQFLGNRAKMAAILEQIAEKFFIGDVGITDKNYVNWGIRMDGSLVILDYAYIYNVKFNLFTCTCESESLLQYDNDYVHLVCPSCGRKFKFGEIRRKITRQQQQEEIGDIRRLSYNLTEAVQKVTIVPEFEPTTQSETTKEQSEKAYVKKFIKRYYKKKKMEKYGLIPDDLDGEDLDAYVDAYEMI